jgi:hypothetical protein
MVGFVVSSQPGVREVLPHLRIGPSCEIVSVLLLRPGAGTRRPNRLIRALAAAGRWSHVMSGPVRPLKIGFVKCPPDSGPTLTDFHCNPGFVSWTKG